MLKSPEEYFSSFSFDPPESSSHELTSGERIFVEKYLGLDAMELMPELAPEKEPLHFPFKPAEPPRIIEVAQDEPQAVGETSAEEPSSPDREIEKISPSLTGSDVIASQGKAESSLPVIELEHSATILEVASEKKREDTSEITEELSEDASTQEPVEKPVEIILTAKVTPDEVDQKVQNAHAVPSEKVDSGIALNETGHNVLNVAPAVAIEDEKPISQPDTETQLTIRGMEIPAMPSLRDKLKDEPEIQMVSFFIAGQLFLLPVIAIQEVLRHQELVKVPQAPDFVAGAINLRGRVTPLVYLSSLLTNADEHNYSSKNFIIICGTSQLQIGLIIDRIKSMHMIRQEKIIWNAEAKLGEAAEFLCAIANLDDKVCGVVAPEIIAQKILMAG